MVIVPAAACLNVPTGIDSAIASLAEPMACAVRAIRLAGVGIGDSLMVVGAGPIGLLCALVGREAGASVAITDINPYRMAIAQKWGFGYTADPGSGDPEIAEQSKQESYDSAIDAVGLAVTRRQAIGSVRRGGQVVFVGLHGPDVSFDGNDLVRNEVQITGSFAYTPEDFETARGLLARGLLPEDDSWLSLRPLESGPESFRELVDDQPGVLKIVLQP
jgi:threonine dehydrogenase-like Zn-dependent dehydrogenase